MLFWLKFHRIRRNGNRWLSFCCCCSRLNMWQDRKEWSGMGWRWLFSMPSKGVELGCCRPTLHAYPNFLHLIHICMYAKGKGMLQLRHGMTNLHNLHKKLKGKNFTCFKNLNIWWHFGVFFRIIHPFAMPRSYSSSHRQLLSVNSDKI